MHADLQPGPLLLPAGHPTLFCCRNSAYWGAQAVLVHKRWTLYVSMIRNSRSLLWRLGGILNSLQVTKYLLTALLEAGNCSDGAWQHAGSLHSPVQGAGADYASPTMFNI